MNRIEAVQVIAIVEETIPRLRARMSGSDGEAGADGSTFRVFVQPEDRA